MSALDLNDFRRALTEENAGLADLPGLDESLKHLISDHHMVLPQRMYDRAAKAIQDLFAYAHSPAHVQATVNAADDLDREILQKGSRHYSLLMAYDFHYDQSTDQLSLIEINTNASAFMFADFLYRYKGLTTWENARADLWNAFLQEYALFCDGGHAELEFERVDIMDENIPAQKMYAEFLIFQDWLAKQGKSCDIVDFAQYGGGMGATVATTVAATTTMAASPVPFVYNRYCDFNFSEPRSAHLRRMYLDDAVLFSPSPYEYLVLADKMRQFDFYAAGVSDVIIPVHDFKQFADAKELWNERRKYYFKPKRMYGGKAVFRGSSISRKRFDEIFPQDYLAQETRPPGHWNDWKYDLRFYVYRDQVQLVIARLFQGQLLNFATPGGGLTTVSFE